MTQISRIVSLLENGTSVLLHGPGGCGKTYSIKEVAIILTQQGMKIACTATTGKAAINLNIPEYKIMARTLHSWAGVGMAKSSALKLMAKIKSSKKYVKSWNETDVLIIDEISMLGAEFFGKLDYIAKNVRMSGKPFGGLTLFLSGDFMQLPPVKDRWVFEGPEWNALNFTIIPMLEPKRYDDIRWFEILQRIRKGSFTQDDIKLLYKRELAYNNLKTILESENNADVIKPTILYSRKIDVESYNEDELDKLPSQPVVFVAVDQHVPKNPTSRIEDYIPSLEDAIPDAIILKVGAQVMLRTNLDISIELANGSRGVVIDIIEINSVDINYKHYVKVRFINGVVHTITPHVWEVSDKNGKASRTQIPLILAWSCTIHKIQGSTLDYAVADCGPSIFAYGQAYVALSRVRNIKGLFLSEFYPNSLKTNKHALKYTNSIEIVDEDSDEENTENCEELILNFIDDSSE